MGPLGAAAQVGCCPNHSNQNLTACLTRLNHCLWPLQQPRTVALNRIEDRTSAKASGGNLAPANAKRVCAEQRALPKGMSKKDMPQHGNCLFHAAAYCISKLTKSELIDHHHLRAECVSHLANMTSATSMIGMVKCPMVPKQTALTPTVTPWPSQRRGAAVLSCKPLPACMIQNLSFSRSHLTWKFLPSMPNRGNMLL